MLVCTVARDGSVVKLNININYILNSLQLHVEHTIIPYLLPFIFRRIHFNHCNIGRPFGRTVAVLTPPSISTRLLTFQHPTRKDLWQLKLPGCFPIVTHSFCSKFCDENTKGSPHHCSARHQGVKWPLNKSVRKTTETRSLEPSQL